MKTIRMWFIILVAMVITGITSCTKTPELLEVIESEILDEGIGKNIESTPQVLPDGTEGTELSYKSWIKVKGQTKANFENKVEVTLKGSFTNVEEVHPVYRWNNLGQIETSISRYVREKRREGFVTITDSVLIYTVQLNEFSFSYELGYEVGVYDDGATRQTMPYHYYDKITDNGGVIEVIDSYDDGTKAYARQVYHHSITVEFGGKSYDIKADITLQRELGPANKPYILRSKVTGQSLTPKAEKAFLSTMNVKSVWSNGREETQSYTAELPFLGGEGGDGEITIHGSKENLVFQGSSLEKMFSDDEDGGEYIKLERLEYNCILRYNSFTFKIPFICYGASFDNIVLCEKFNAYEYDAESIQVTKMDWRVDEEEEDHIHYYLSIYVKMNIGTTSVEGIYGCCVVLIKD